MAILPQIGVVQEGNMPLPERPLTQTSSFIQSLSLYMKELFFGAEGILVSRRGGFNQPRIYPSLNISYISNPLLFFDEVPQVWISIDKEELSPEHLMSASLESLLLGINELMKTLEMVDANSSVRVFVTVKGALLEALMPNKSEFLKLVASFLYLYKDVLSCRPYVLEDTKVQILRRELEQAGEGSTDLTSCGALKEMLLCFREWVINNPRVRESTENIDEGYPRHLQEMQVLLGGYEGVARSLVGSPMTVSDMPKWMRRLSGTDFGYMLYKWGRFLPENILQEAIQERGPVGLPVLLEHAMITSLKLASLDLLQNMLQDISINDLHKILRGTSVRKLMIILQQLPRDLLPKVLLEMPKDITLSLKQKMSDTRLLEPTRLQIKQYLAEMNQLSLKDKERPVPSLRSLVVSSILVSSKRDVRGSKSTPLSPIYLQRMMLYPGLKEEVLGQTRASVATPVEGEYGDFSFTKPPSSDYRSELDLFPLASLAPGYEGVLEKVLLEKCGDN